jgi:hypothetical protein
MIPYGKENNNLEPIIVEYNLDNNVSYLFNQSGLTYSNGKTLENILTDFNFKLVPIKYEGDNYGKLKDITFWFSPSDELLEKLPEYYSNIISNELNNNCEDNEASILQSCNNNPNIISYNLYPNPTMNDIKLNIRTKKIINCEINIFDLPGNQIGTLGTHKFKGKSKVEFDLRQLKPGLYTLNIVSDQGDYLNLKFIKR